jgi:BarA-like signal transduction histidine kinase
MEDQTFQPILAKLNDFLSEEPMEVTHSDNLSTKQQVYETHFDNTLRCGK